MATKPPSDADIFLDEDDDGSSWNTPRAGAGGPKRPASAGSGMGAPKKKKKKLEDYDFDDYDYSGIAEELKYRLVRAPKQERDKMAAAFGMLGTPGLSVAERVALKKQVATATANLKRIENENKDFVKSRNKFNTVRTDSGARLKALRTYMKTQKQISPEETKQFKELEQDLLQALDKQLSERDHEGNEKLVATLEKIQKQTGNLPKQLQDQFEELEKKTEIILSAQEEAAQMLDDTHKKIKDFGKKAGWGLLNHAGIGPFTLGNAVRGAIGIHHGYKAAKAKVKGGLDFVSNYRTSRKVVREAQRGVDVNLSPGSAGDDTAQSSAASPVPVPQTTARPHDGLGLEDVQHDPNDPLTHPRKKGKKATKPVENMTDYASELDPASGRPGQEQGREDGSSQRRRGKDKKKRAARGTAMTAPVSSQEDRRVQDESLKEQQKLNEILEKHTASMQRFNSRLLAELRGRAKPAAQSGNAGNSVLSSLGSTLSDLGGTLGGLMKSVGPLASLLGKGAALGGAFAAGHWVGTKVYEKYGEDIGKGVDKTADFAQHVMGKETNNDKIDHMLSGKVTQADHDALPEAAKKRIAEVKAKKAAGSAIPTPVAPPVATPDVPTSAVVKTPGDFKRLERDTGGGSTEAPPTPTAQATPIVTTPTTSMPSASSDSPISPAGKDKGKSVGGRVRDWMGKLFTKSSGVDTDGLKGQMQDSLVKMGKEYTDATGKKLNFNSAFRSMEEQEELYRTKPKGMAGKPGSSLHNFGLAVDIPSVQTNELDSLGLLKKYGFTRPIANEKWHVQPAGVSVAAAKQGVYSADAPVNQGGKKDSASGATAVANQGAPAVTNAEYEAPGSANSPAKPGLNVAASSGSNGTVGGSKISATSIPTFDNSDGMFLALNTGIV